jgi:hypothetical protein
MVYQSHVTSLAHSIQARLGVPVLAEIPLAPGGAIPDPPDEPFLEGARFVRAGLQAQGSSLPTVVIVPVRHSIQAMTVARYVARSFAEAGRPSAIVLLTETVPLLPLLKLPAGADLPAESFVNPSVAAGQIEQGGLDTLVVYCPPTATSLAALPRPGAVVLLADDDCTLDSVQRAYDLCANGGTPVTAAAVMTRPHTRRWPFNLLRLFRQFLPPRMRDAH